MHAHDERSAALVFRPRLEVSALERPRESPEEKLARRQQRKAAKLLAEASRPLDAWERYRALVDTLEQGIDLEEMADRKVRFAMVVMASLNVAVLALASRPELVGLANLSLRGWLGPYLLTYAVVAVYFFVQAIETLRPRTGRPQGAARGWRLAEAGRLRPMAQAAAQEAADYANAWREARFDQLHHELALQSHRQSQVNEEKYAALGRLYGGLKVLALLFGGFVLFAGLSSAFASLRGTP